MRVCLSLLLAFTVYLPIAFNHPSTPAAQSSAVWFADHETGDLSQWSQGMTNSALQDSGTCTRPPNGVSTDVAHSGQYSMKMTIDSTVQGSGCRQFRYPEIMSGDAYYYSVWLYYPENYIVNGHTNIFQFKSKPASDGESVPMWIVRTENRENGNMFYVLDWEGGTYHLAGPWSGHPEENKSYKQSILDIPVAQWTHLEVYFRPSGQFYGRIKVWQDGVLLFDKNDIRTKYPGSDNLWSVNNYGQDILPNPVVLYIDDAVISTERVGAEIFESP